ncbi:Putative amidohydrolase ytcJ [Termitomyces sp. J132]|nr:hypothetical protein H2248_002550 [Termitomyces sp. 'cryptogamus']KNZ75527.1 Putative amidohydrolase ytcJ [Termitomyces sp. J132]
MPEKSFVTRSSNQKTRLPAPSLRTIFRAAFISIFVLAWAFDTYNALFDEETYFVCSESNNIYTVDEFDSRVACISVKGSTIFDTGSYDDLIQRSLPRIHSYIPDELSKFLRRTPTVCKIDPSYVVVPGLADAHAHVIEYGFMKQLPLAGTQSLQEILDRIKAYIHEHPEIKNDTTKWIEGMGWDQTKWPTPQFPTASDLEQDPLLKGRPISLSRVDGHAKWVSPRVLELIRELPDHIEGGLIVRDADGLPTGVFVDNAMALIPTPEWTEEKMNQFFDKTMKGALSHGLTSIHNAMTTPQQIQFFKKKAEAGELPNRLYLMGHVSSNEYWGSQIPRLVNYGKQGHLTVKSVKLVADGALGSWGAALLEPYSDKAEDSGLLLTPPEELSALVHQFWKDGFQVNIHCIGDRANHVVLDIFEDIIAQRGGNITEWRPRIEHAQIMTLDDIKRTGRLGVLTSVQPTHATSDMSYAETRLGPERIKGAYAYQSLLQASPNHVLPLGSDFPVESIDPLLGFYAAVARLRFDPEHPDAPGSSPHGSRGWYPEQKLTRAQALKGMTLDAAYASFAENEIGSLSPGKKADFVVLNKDIMTIPVADILKTKVTATVVDGKIVYGDL